MTKYQVVLTLFVSGKPARQRAIDPTTAEGKSLMAEIEKLLPGAVHAAEQSQPGFEVTDVNEAEFLKFTKRRSGAFNTPVAPPDLNQYFATVSEVARFFCVTPPNIHEAFGRSLRTSGVRKYAGCTFRPSAELDAEFK